MVLGLMRWVLRHRLAVVVGWLVLAVCGGVAAGSLGGALSKKFSIPGAAIRTNERVAHQFGTGGSPLVPGVRVPSGDLRQPGLARQVERAFERVAAAEPGSRVASYATTGIRRFCRRIIAPSTRSYTRRPVVRGSSSVRRSLLRCELPPPWRWPGSV